MTAKGYTDSAGVAAYLGTVFTADQDAQVDALLESVETYIDARTGKSSLAGATITSEDHFGPINGSSIWLDNPPILAVTSITARAGLSDTSPATLVAGTDYEVRSLTTGELWVAAFSGVDRFRVTYTTANTVNPLDALIAKALIAHFMRPALEGVLPGLSSYSVGGELSVSFQSALSEMGVPAEVEALIRARQGWAFA